MLGNGVFFENLRTLQSVLDFMYPLCKSWAVAAEEPKSLSLGVQDTLSGVLSFVDQALAQGSHLPSERKTHYRPPGGLIKQGLLKEGLIGEPMKHS